MAQTENTSYPEWLHYFDTLNSTNNYAMQFIDDGMAHHGDVIWAKLQSEGKGQRGKKWEDNAGNLKMSLLIKPSISADQQFILSMVVANTIVDYLKDILPSSNSIAVKWPNDIYINDKKACGILIENVFRGMKWCFSVIGIGLNIHQTQFPEILKKATSLKAEGGGGFDLLNIIESLRAGIINRVNNNFVPEKILKEYNTALYKKDKSIRFRDLNSGKLFEAFITEVNLEGKLLLLTPLGIRAYSFGDVEWVFDL